MRTITGFVSALLISSVSMAQEVRVFYTNFPPFAFTKNNKTDGYVLRAVQEIAKRTKLSMKESLTVIAEVPKLSETENALFVVIQRNPERESQLQWVGKVLEDRLCFGVMKDKPEIKTLDDAKKLGKVGASKGSSSEKFLIKNGFNNIDLSTGHPGSVRKLFANKIDAWMMGESVVMATAKMEGFDNSKIRCDGDFNRSQFWVAASKKMSPEQLKIIQTAFQEIEKEGLLKKLFAEYR